MSTYGNRQLSLIFFPVVETHANGFIFKEEVLWVGGSRADRGVGKGVAAFQHGARLSCAERALHSQGGKAILVNGRVFEKKASL